MSAVQRAQTLMKFGTKQSLFILMSCLLLHPGTGFAANKPVVVATTTGINSSGLVKLLKPAFEKDMGYQLIVEPVGSGRAMHLAREGQVDLVFVHVPASEQAFIDQGYGERRIPVMRNSFVIIGPKQDPAAIAGLTDATEAMRRIANSQSLFISRADDSGTHQKELELWRSAGLVPNGAWYLETGQVMSMVFKLANSKLAYALIDYATWLSGRDSSPLQIEVRGDKRLINIYSIVTLNKRKFPDRNHKGAAAFVRWITSDKGKALIQSMIVHGEPLYMLME